MEGSQPTADRLLHMQPGQTGGGRRRTRNWFAFMEVQDTPPHTIGTACERGPGWMGWSPSVGGVSLRFADLLSPAVRLLRSGRTPDIGSGSPYSNACTQEHRRLNHLPWRLRLPSWSLALRLSTIVARPAPVHPASASCMCISCFESQDLRTQKPGTSSFQNLSEMNFSFRKSVFKIRDKNMGRNMDKQTE